MGETTAIKAENRSDTGTRRTQALREQGILPGVIYGHGGDPEPIQLPTHDFEFAVTHGARALHLDIAGKMGQFLIKEVQYDHLGIKPLHFDLMRVNLQEKVEVTVGLELKGEPAGAKDGGVLDTLLSELEIECRVTDIPETLTPNISHLAINDSLLAKEIELPDGVGLVTDPEEMVCIVREPRAEAEPEEVEEEAAEEGSEPEMIGRTAKEEEGEN